MRTRMERYKDQTDQDQEARTKRTRIYMGVYIVDCHHIVRHHLSMKVKLIFQNLRSLLKAGKATIVLSSMKKF